jgi:lipoic acid synthetase
VATFLIMGKVCTRSCRFCAVDSGTPSALDPDEPLRLAEEVKRLGLRFVVVTSVTRDDLADGGAGHFARVIEVMRRECPGVGIEVLIPDFQGSRPALKTVVDASPEVLNHNVETVPRLYSSVRPQADYGRSLEVLRTAKALAPSLTTKSGLMVGLGETREEVLEVMVDLRSASCDVITIGQYLSPSAAHHPVVEYVKPEIFEKYHRDALRLGFRDAASGPFVRSSYMAEKYYKKPGTRDEG